MSKGRVLVTGATGMVGGLVAQRCIQAGYDVRALVRKPTDDGPLATLGVEQYAGDLANLDSLPGAFQDVQFMVHSAAHVGDWGPAEKYRAINVVSLEHMITAAAKSESFQRWVQVSSLGVYAGIDHHGTDETTPPDVSGLDGYTRTKAEAEVLLKEHMDRGFPAVAVRPGFIYGPGDRHVLPPLIDKLQAGKMKLIGDGKKKLNNTYVGNLVDALMLALENDQAVGEIFNVRDGRLVDRVEFVGSVADYLGVPRPKHVPLGVAKVATALIERIAKARGRKTAPLLTQARMKFLTLNLDFSIEKAQRVLGYDPQVDFQDGIKAALDWATGKTSDGEVSANNAVAS